MKKIKLLLALALMLGFSSSVVLAEGFTSNQELIGSWLLGYTKKSLEDSDKKPMGTTWVFDKSQLIQKDIPQARGNPYDSPAVNYVIENGNLKVSILGRAGKFDVYSLVEKTDSAMVLKDDKYGTYMYFTKK